MPADLIYMSVTVYNSFLTAYMSLKLNNYQLYCLFVFLFVCLFVCLFVVYRPTRKFFTYMETSPLPNFDLCSALMAIEQ